MAYENVHRGARISPTKVRLDAALIRGRSVAEALSILQLSKRRGATYLRQALLAARANAEESGEVNVRRLVVTDARVDSGPTIKRFRPKDRGRAHSILKRTSHITVAVDEA
ncbi:MAG: 50S ribosomal protein L22 [Phycisphaeraceae bacterium]|nr:50S ribosomal protein L22 [Phycisphaeraceae bacterium]